LPILSGNLACANGTRRHRRNLPPPTALLVSSVSVEAAERRVGGSLCRTSGSTRLWRCCPSSVSNIRYRRIPNWLTLGGVVTGVALNSVPYQGLPGLKLSLAGRGVAFGSYMLLYLVRSMGAGDVKLMAAIGAMVGFRDWFGIFLVTALIGGVAGIALVAARGRLLRTFWDIGFILSELKQGWPAYVRNEELDVRSPKAMGLPPGAVIGAGTLVFLGTCARYGQ